VRDVEAYRTYSAAFKINIACERLPQYKAFDPQACGFAYPTYAHIGPTIEYLERAYDDAKYGDWSRDPFITPVAPSFVDDTVAPPGKHVVHLFGGTRPTRFARRLAEPQGGVRANVPARDGRARARLLDGIIGMQVLTPPDIEAIIGSPHGHIFTANCSPTSSSSPGPRRTSPTTAARSRVSTSAAPPPIRAAASAPCPATTPPARS
jgi:phytoene dehydrogenase-like protein